MIYLSLGSNLGHRLEHLQKAAQLLKKLCFPRTPLYTTLVLETEAILHPEDPSHWHQSYLNTIVYGHTDLSLSELHRITCQIEQELGKKPHSLKNEPRTIDIDILLYKDCIISNNTIEIPHPRITQRPFLLQLLSSICPELTLPTETHSCLSILQSTPITQIYKKSYVLFPKVVGILNLTPDSFSDGNSYNTTDKAISHIHQLLADGASIIDIGGQSTRPQSSPMPLPWQEEWHRIEPVLQALRSHPNMSISIDSFSEEVISHVLDQFSIQWINDVSDQVSDIQLHKMIEHHVGIMAMHSLSVPVKKGMYLSLDQSPIPALLEWAQRKYQYLSSLGFKDDQIILDPGLSFGKQAQQNWHLLRLIFDAMRVFHVPLLCGHSRKSFLNSVTQAPPQERDIETATLCSLLSHPDMLFRVHNVHMCQRVLTTQQMLTPLVL